MIKDQSIFSWVIILLILITSSHDNVWISLGENCCWILLGLKGLIGLSLRTSFPFGSLRSWRYCVDARLKFGRRSWRLRRQISLDYITTALPPNLTRLLRNTASYAIHLGTPREVMLERHAKRDARARSEERNLPPLAARLARQKWRAYYDRLVAGGQ